MDRLSLFLLAGSAVFNALANTLMKLAFGHQKNLLDGGAFSAVLSIVSNPWAIAGVGCFGVSFIFLSASLTRTDLSMAYPFMSGLVFLLILAVSTLVFSEQVNVWRIAGMISILAGIWLIAAKG
jgi:multidrug transporter EmrE-like cation transporter